MHSLHQVHKINVQWGGQVCVHSCTCSMSKAFNGMKITYVNIAFLLPVNPFTIYDRLKKKKSIYVLIHVFQKEKSCKYVEGCLSTNTCIWDVSGLNL